VFFAETILVMETKDSNGAPLNDGDIVTLIKER